MTLFLTLIAIQFYPKKRIQRSPAPDPEEIPVPAPLSMRLNPKPHLSDGEIALAKRAVVHLLTFQD